MTPALFFFFIFVKFSFLPFNHLCRLCPSLSLEDFAIQRDEHLTLLMYLDSYVPHNQSYIPCLVIVVHLNPLAYNFCIKVFTIQ